MEILYTSVEIHRLLDNFKETRKYYIIKDDSYGIKVTTLINEELVEKEVLKINNITGSENETKLLIDKIIECDDNYEQAEYIIEDYVENKLKNSFANIEKRTDN